MLIVVAVLALAWNALVLALAILAIAPAPNPALWLVAVMVQGTSLLVVAAGGVGITLAVVTAVLGGPGLAVVAALTALVAVVIGVVPVWAGVSTARVNGTPLSLRRYLASPTWTGRRPRLSFVFATPADAPGGLALDVLSAPGDRGAPRPAVVLVHGGGWVVGGRGGTARWNEWLADQGYVVFDVDYRLAPPPRWQDAPSDVKSAIAWIRDRADEHGVDPSRIAVVGASAGGHLALLAAYISDDRPVAAVAAFYPDTDLTTLPPSRRPRWASAGAAEHLIAFLGAPPAEVPDRAKWASPMAHVRPDVPPTLLVHGQSDQLVAPAQSARLAARLRDCGVRVELLELPLANHSFDLSWGAWSTQIARTRLGAFLAQYLASDDPVMP